MFRNLNLIYPRARGTVDFTALVDHFPPNFPTQVQRYLLHLCEDSNRVLNIIIVQPAIGKVDEVDSYNAQEREKKRESNGE